MSLRKQKRVLWNNFLLRGEAAVKNADGVYDQADVKEWCNQKMGLLEERIAATVAAVKTGMLPTQDVIADLNELERYIELLDFAAETDEQLGRFDRERVIKIPSRVQEEEQLQLLGFVRLFDPHCHVVVSDNRRVNCEETQKAQFEEAHQFEMDTYDKQIAALERAKSIKSEHDNLRRNAWLPRHKTWGDLERDRFGYPP